MSSSDGTSSSSSSSSSSSTSSSLSSSSPEPPLASWDLPFDFTNTQRQLISGGVAGCVAKTLTAPLSRLTILFQVHSMVTTKPHAPAFSDGMLSGLRKIVGKEGFLSFWKGNMTSVVHRFPYSAINFHAYETVMRLLGAPAPSSKQQQQQQAPIGTNTIRFLAGATAGGIATASCYPLDLVRTRLTTQLGNPTTSETGGVYYRGILHCLYRIAADEGLLGFYRGLGVTLLVQIPNLAISYSMYGFLRDMALHRLGQQSAAAAAAAAAAEAATTSSSSSSTTTATAARATAARSVGPAKGEKGLDKSVVVLVNMGCGALSGVSSTLVIYPLDVLRRRMQLQGLHRTPSNQTGVAYEVMAILRAEGAAGMYRGLTPELCKIVPMVGCTFCVYEAMRDVLQVER